MKVLSIVIESTCDGQRKYFRFFRHILVTLPRAIVFYYSIFFLFENVTKILVMHSFIKQKKTECIRMFAGIVNSINFGTWWSSKKKG